MSRKFHRPNRDTNHARIVEDLRHLGYQVFDTAALGSGFPDIIVTGIRYYGSCYHEAAVMVEIKTDAGKLTPAEARWFDELRHTDTAIVARNAGDVLRWFRGG